MPLEIPEVPEAPPTNKLGVIASTVGPAGAIIALGVVIYAVRAGTMRYRRKHP